MLNQSNRKIIGRNKLLDCLVLTFSVINFILIMFILIFISTPSVTVYECPRDAVECIYD